MRFRVDIFDRQNHRRLLGSMEQPGASPDDCFFRLHVADLPPVRMDCHVWTEIKVEAVEFNIQTMHSENGWVKRRVLLTDAPLATLMKMATFRLPGETSEQAEVRRDFA